METSEKTVGCGLLKSDQILGKCCLSADSKWTQYLQQLAVKKNTGEPATLQANMDSLAFVSKSGFNLLFTRTWVNLFYWFYTTHSCPLQRIETRLKDKERDADFSHLLGCHCEQKWNTALAYTETFSFTAEWWPFLSSLAAWQTLLEFCGFWNVYIPDGNEVKQKDNKQENILRGEKRKALFTTGKNAILHIHIQKQSKLMKIKYYSRLKMLNLSSVVLLFDSQICLQNIPH